MSRQRIGLLFGGRSPEHEVSLQSAWAIWQAFDHHRYELILVGINPQGHWHHCPNPSDNDMALPTIASGSSSVTLLPADQGALLWDVAHGQPVSLLDGLFCIIHGAQGEDGGIQGLAHLLDVPCVGSDLLGTALCMDKDYTKRLLTAANLPVTPGIVVHQHQPKASWQPALANLRYPLFVKPANAGSSVGVSCVKHTQQLDEAIALAGQFDQKILIEQRIVGRELECAVLGNDNPKASGIGEIRMSQGFYDYRSKYLDPQAAQLIIPADLPDATTIRLQQLACQAFQVLGLKGLARVDFFLASDQQIYINELNTLPGFTAISMYPKLWQQSGLRYADLLSRLVELAFEAHGKNA